MIATVAKPNIPIFLSEDASKARESRVLQTLRDLATSPRPGEAFRVRPDPESGRFVSPGLYNRSHGFKMSESRPNVGLCA